MGLLKDIFTKQKAEQAMAGYFKTLSAYQPVFTSYEGGIYEMEITRAAIHAIATHCSKLMPEVQGSRKDLARTLRYKPNRWMDTTKFLALLSTYLEVNNTAFIAPIYDARDERTIVGYYPVMPDMAEIKSDTRGKAWLCYTFRTGEKAAVPLDESGVLTQRQYRKEFFGESNAALLPTMQLIDIQNQGIMEGVKQSAALRFMAKLVGTMGEAQINKSREDFRKNNLNADNNSGVLMFDGRYAEVKQIDSKPYVISADQMKLINESVFNYFGVNESILRNDWHDSASWQAFYEGKIEPFALQLGLVMTNMTYSEREIAYGNSIMYSSNRLQYATTAEKLNTVIQMFDRGLLSTNQALDIFNLPHVPDGDERYIRGEYVNINDRSSGTDGGYARASQLQRQPVTEDEKQEEDDGQE